GDPRSSEFVDQRIVPTMGDVVMILHGDELGDAAPLGDLRGSDVAETDVAHEATLAKLRERLDGRRDGAFRRTDGAEARDFIGDVRAVDVGGVDVDDPTLDGLAQHGDRSEAISRRTEHARPREQHGAVADAMHRKGPERVDFCEMRGSHVPQRWRGITARQDVAIRTGCAVICTVDGRPRRSHPVGRLKLNVPTAAATLVLPRIVPPFLAKYRASASKSSPTNAGSTWSRRASMRASATTN